MDKPTWVVLQIDRTADDFWWGTLESVEGKKVYELPQNRTIITIPVKSYSLNDHQFISVKLDSYGHKGVVLLIPRAIVRTIIESKTDLSAAFSFAGSKIK